jgi:Fe-S-cluster containining protein
MSLPMVSDAPCFGCTTPCCFEYVVPVNGHDLWRLARDLSLPWAELVTVRKTPDDWAESFMLDDGTDRYAFMLRKRADGGCAMLVTLGAHHRCGVHASRPLACRVYPMHAAWRAPTGIDFASHALCPPPQRARFDAIKGALADEVIDQLGERALYVRVVARWEQAARQRPRARPFVIDDYVRWTLALYGEIQTLRQGPRVEWQRRAESCIAVYPLPSEWAPGC